MPATSPVVLKWSRHKREAALYVVLAATGIVRGTFQQDCALKLATSCGVSCRRKDQSFSFGTAGWRILRKSAGLVGKRKLTRGISGSSRNCAAAAMVRSSAKSLHLQAASSPPPEQKASILELGQICCPVLISHVLQTHLEAPSLIARSSISMIRSTSLLCDLLTCESTCPGE